MEKIVSNYLKTKLEADDFREETYIEIAQRLCDDKVLERATLKLFELDTGWLDLSRRNYAAVQDAGEMLVLTDTASLLAIYYKNPQTLNA